MPSSASCDGDEFETAMVQDAAAPRQAVLSAELCAIPTLNVARLLASPVDEESGSSSDEPPKMEDGSKPSSNVSASQLLRISRRAAASTPREAACASLGMAKQSGTCLCRSWKAAQL